MTMWWAFTLMPWINPMGAVTGLGRVASSIVAEWAPSQFDEANGIVRSPSPLHLKVKSKVKIKVNEKANGEAKGVSDA